MDKPDTTVATKGRNRRQIAEFTCTCGIPHYNAEGVSLCKRMGHYYKARSPKSCAHCLNDNAKELRIIANHWVCRDGYACMDRVVKADAEKFANA